MLDSNLTEDVSYNFSGENLMINRAAESLFSGQVKSLLVLLALIFVIMSLLFTSVIAGVVSLVPNIIPVVLNFGLMGMLGIPLNPSTATVAAIALGIAIDDTTHLLTRYNDSCREDPDTHRAAQATLWAESVPVISTSIALGLGFGILFFSEFAIVAQFGALAALTMIYAMLADLLVTPIILRNLHLVGIWEIVALRVGREVLDESPIFAGMSKYQIRKAVLLSEVSRAAEGEEVTVQGTVGSNMYVILDGKVEVVRSEEGRSRTLASLGAGDVFGEIGFVGEIKRSATVRITEDALLLVLDAESTERALRLYPRIATRLHQNISRILADRLASADSTIGALSATT